MRPFLRWAGGKRWLARQGVVDVSGENRIVEPFLGGGALFFASNWEAAALSDVNRFLINAYVWMRDDCVELFRLLMEHFDSHSRDYYYSVRTRMGDSSVQDAADFIYLNRACFNGLFRVNLAGRFNVPIGTKVYELRDVSEFHGWSRRLQSASLGVADFEETVDSCGAGDFIFADPPYTVNHNSNGFIEYNEKIFSWDDQVRLAACLCRASERGAKFLLTNADHDSVRQLYPKELAFISKERGSEMAGSTAFRTRTTELLVASVPDVLTRSAPARANAADVAGSASGATL